MSLHPIASACRSCRYYTPEGRRGGHCQQLGVPVRGGWEACAIAIPAFAPTGENLEKMLWDNEILKLQQMRPLKTSSDNQLLDTPQPKSNPVPSPQTPISATSIASRV